METLVTRAGRRVCDVPNQDRAPIDVGVVTAAVAGSWLVRTTASTGSTNADLVASGSVDRSVLVAELQTAGRGRLGRTWTAPAGSGLLFSVALDVSRIPAVRRGWVGALLGLALREAVGDRTGLQATLKWPNDLLIGGRKCAGVLAELNGDTVVVGAGLNVSTTTAELPRPDATSLAIEGAGDLDRAALLGSVLTAFGRIVDPGWPPTATSRSPACSTATAQPARPWAAGSGSN